MANPLKTALSADFACQLLLLLMASARDAWLSIRLPRHRACFVAVMPAEVAAVALDSALGVVSSAYIGTR